MIDPVKEACAPKVEAALRDIGKWLFSPPDRWECSECGHKVRLYDVRYFCPRCGAEMLEEETIEE